MARDGSVVRRECFLGYHEDVSLGLSLSVESHGPVDACILAL